MGECRLLRRPGLAQQEVGQIGVGCILLEPGGYVVVDAGGLAHLPAPLVVAAAVGKQGDTTASQAFQPFYGQSATARRGHPQVLRTVGGHDECRLLALDDADVLLRVPVQQVFAIQALVERPVQGQPSGTYQCDVRPALVAAAVAVGMVLHDVSAVYASLAVYLPEDDVALPGGSHEVVVVDAPQLLLTDGEACGDGLRQPLPKGALRRMAAQDVGRVQWLEGRQGWWRCVLRFRLNTHLCPLVVAVVFGRGVVVAAGVLVVALAHRVVHVAVAVLGVDVAHQALPSSALRTGELAGLVARQVLAL